MRVCVCVSVVGVPAEVAEPLLRDPRKRATALQRLVEAIPSEMEGAEVQVGPELDGDEQDRDTKPWTAGFDSPGCCVGLYSAQQSRAPDANITGMHRSHSAYFLVCKAGGGLHQLRTGHVLTINYLQRWLLPLRRRHRSRAPPVYRDLA